MPVITLHKGGVASTILYNMYVDFHHRNVSLITKDRTVVDAHSCVLAAISPFLKAHFNERSFGKFEVKLPHVDIETLEFILELIYHGRVRWQEEDVEEEAPDLELVLSAARLLQMQEVEQCVEDFLKSTPYENVGPSNSVVAGGLGMDNGSGLAPVANDDGDVMLNEHTDTFESSAAAVDDDCNIVDMPGRNCDISVADDVICILDSDSEVDIEGDDEITLEGVTIAASQYQDALPVPAVRIKTEPVNDGYPDFQHSYVAGVKQDKNGNVGSDSTLLGNDIGHDIESRNGSKSEATLGLLSNFPRRVSNTTTQDRAATGSPKTHVDSPRVSQEDCSGQYCDQETQIAKSLIDYSSQSYAYDKSYNDRQIEGSSRRGPFTPSDDCITQDIIQGEKSLGHGASDTQDTIESHESTDLQSSDITSSQNTSMDSSLSNEDPPELSEQEHMEDQALHTPLPSPPALTSQRSGGTEDKQKPTCPKCGKVFPALSTMVTHKAKCQITIRHYATKSCHICNVNFLSVSLAVKHFIEEHRMLKPYICKHCYENFSRPNELRLHFLRECQNSFINGKRKRSSEETLERKRRKDSPKLAKATLKQPMSNNLISDPTSLDPTRNIVAMNMKLNVHDALDLKCPFCDFEGITLNNISKHMQTVHDEEYILRCKVCHIQLHSKHVARRHALSSHIELAKPRDSKQTCSRCNSSFNTIPALNVHVRHCNAT